jgi:hypothetical protein
MITAYLLVFLTSNTPIPASSKVVGASVCRLMQPNVHWSVALFHGPESCTVEEAIRLVSVGAGSISYWNGQEGGVAERRKYLAHNRGRTSRP